jgi:NitT/TauT family transport system permease protein
MTLAPASTQTEGLDRPVWYSTRTGQTVLAILVFAAALFAWWGIVRALGLSALVLPTPYEVAQSLVESTASGLLLTHLWVTLSEVILGFLLGSFVGIALGTLAAHSPLIRTIINPYILASQAMPKLALAPIMVIWLGFGIAPKVVITALICFFPLLENTIIGLTSANPYQVELFRVLTASRWQTFYKLQIPSALPVIFAGLRVAITLAVVGAVVGEYVGANRGLGALIIALMEQTFFSWRRVKRED